MDLEILQGRYGRKVVQVEIHNNWTVQSTIIKNNEIGIDNKLHDIHIYDWTKNK